MGNVEGAGLGPKNQQGPRFYTQEQPQFIKQSRPRKNAKTLFIRSETLVSQKNAWAKKILQKHFKDVLKKSRDPKVRLEYLKDKKQWRPAKSSVTTKPEKDGEYLLP